VRRRRERRRTPVETHTPLRGLLPERQHLNKPEFCAEAIAENMSCPTSLYKSGTRAHLESLGWDILANFGDQFSDLVGGFADKTFKLPNPNYFCPNRI
jgi:putative acid phosphatase of HAD superfamily subfamily IIIB